MAYDYKELENKILEVVKEKELCCISHIMAFLPCARETFYAKKLNESHKIKDAVDVVKIKKKVQMLDNWTKKDTSPQLQKLAMSYLAEDEEIKKMTRIDREMPVESKEDKNVVIQILDDKAIKVN